MPARRRFEELKRPGAVRIAFAVAASLLAIATLLPTLANATRKADPIAASALAPWDGRLTAARSRVMFTSLSKAQSGSAASRAATTALLQDPTAVDALIVLAFQAQLRGDVARSDRYFGLVSSLSRRETGANIWAIEQAVNRGDIADALYRYDLALRASNDVSQILFPILSSALSESSVRTGLLERLTVSPPWTARFIDYAAQNTSRPVATMQFFLAADGTKVRVGDEQWGRVVANLLRAGHPEEAWRYYQTRAPGARRSGSRDPAFAGGRVAGTPFDWQVSQVPELSAAILRLGDSSVLEFAIGNNAGGPLATQTQLFLPGRYELQAETSGIAQDAIAQPFFRLACANGRELGRIPFARSNADRVLTSGSFRVPASCPVQIFTIEVSPADDLSSTTGYVHRVMLTGIEP